MKKLFTVLLFLTICVNPASSQELRVIPYPEGTNTQSEGASSAPAIINHKNSIYFDTMTDYYELASSRNRVILTHYPTYQQTTETTCGPAAALTVLYWFGVKDYTEKSLALEMKTNADHTLGTSPENMLAFFKKIGWNTESSLTHEKFATYEAFMDFVIANLKSGTPIIVENVYWGGHWRVIIGYDTMGTKSTLDDVLIMADPYDTCDHKQDGYAVDNGENFYSMWFDHSILPENQREQPFVTAKP